MTQDPPFVAIYLKLVEEINRLGIKTFSASQDVPEKMPVCRVQLLNNNSTNQFTNARQYSYSFQVDVVDVQNALQRSLVNAYKIMQLCRQLSINGYSVGHDEPSLTSMVDNSTNKTLNRQIIRINYSVIETTAF